MADEPVHSANEAEEGKAVRCPVCGWTDVRLSMPKGLVDGLARVVGLVPYRCRSCGQRFYRGRQDSSEVEE